MRETMFNLLSKNFDYKDEIIKIDRLINENFPSSLNSPANFRPTSIRQELNKNIIRNWKNRYTATNYEELRKKCCNYNGGWCTDYSINEFLLWMEFYLNMTNIFKKARNYGSENVNTIVENIKILLADMNFSFTDIDEENVEIIVHENRPDSSAVAEKIDNENISIDIVRYNHFQLKGKVYEKQSILSQFYKEYEKRKNILSGNGFNTFKSDLSGLFNNIGIRHDEASDRIITERVQNMSDEELEMWCDRTYDMFLTAVLLCDYIDIKPEIKALNDKSSKE